MENTDSEAPKHRQNRETKSKGDHVPDSFLVLFLDDAQLLPKLIVHHLLLLLYLNLDITQHLRRVTDVSNEVTMRLQ